MSKCWCSCNFMCSGADAGLLVTLFTDMNKSWLMALTIYASSSWSEPQEKKNQHVFSCLEKRTVFTCRAQVFLGNPEGR